MPASKLLNMEGCQGTRSPPLLSRTKYGGMPGHPRAASTELAKRLLHLSQKQLWHVSSIDVDVPHKFGSGKGHTGPGQATPPT